MKARNKFLIIAFALLLLISTTSIIVVASSSVTVNFYDNGGLLDSVIVTEGEVPNPTITPDEVIDIDGVGYRFLGWTDVEGGTELVEILPATESASYYSVREAVWYKRTSTSGEVTWYGEGTLLSTVITASNSGDVIVAYTDIDVNKVTDVNNKKITLDLNGNTISTTSYFRPTGDAADITLQNGIVDLTAKELVQMSEYNATNKSVFTVKDVVIKKGADSANPVPFDIRLGNVVLDNVTVNEDEWVVPDSSSKGFITVGYRSRKVSQPINLTIRNSNIAIPKNTIISAGGASGETNGYQLNITIDNSVVSTSSKLLEMKPASTARANCGLNMHLTGNSRIVTGQNFVTVDSGLTSEKIFVQADFGVYFETRPKLTVGTLSLGDGDDLIADYKSMTSGVVIDLWADDYTPVTDYEYSFCIVGDTQCTTYYEPENLHYIYDYILNNKDDKKIQFVFGMGDITDNDTTTEWQNASAQINRLNGQIPYSLVRGNHDSSDAFNACFNNEAYKSQFEGFFDEDHVENAYVTFTVGEVKYLHLVLDLFASDDVLTWAGNIISEHYDHRVIISTHGSIDRSGLPITQSHNDYGNTNSGQQMWEKLYSKYENVFLVLSGHKFSNDLICTQETGIHGNTVTQLLTNGQTLDRKNGALGLVSMLYFSSDGKTVWVEYYSTVYNRHLGKSSQFTITVPEYTTIDPIPDEYLYTLTDALGTTTYYGADVSLETAAKLLAGPTTLTLYGDIAISSTFTLYENLTVDLNGHSILTDGGRFKIANAELWFTNGNVKITNYELVYADEMYSSCAIGLNNVEIYNTGVAPKKSVVELRTGSITLDNVRITSDGWKGTNSLITAGSRTSSVGAKISVDIKNSTLDFGSSGTSVVYFTGMSGEKKGYTGNVNITNSTITTDG